MSCKVQDIFINKKSKFYHVVELKTTENVPISLNGFTVKCQIKESYSTDTALFNLTEANEGIIIIDSVNGIFALNIKSDATDVDTDNGVYDIILMETDFIGLENRVVVKGRVSFKKGVTE